LVEVGGGVQDIGVGRWRWVVVGGGV
jgi:hypothetical protein